MEIKSFVEDFDHCRKTSIKNTFAEQLFSEHLSVKHLSIGTSIIIGNLI